MKDDPRRIMILKGKHIDCFYLVPTEADLKAACLQILTQRVSDQKSGYGFYYRDEMTEDERQMRIGQTSPPRTELERAQDILKNDRGGLAYQLLTEWEGEYDRIILEHAEEIN